MGAVNDLLTELGSIPLGTSVEEVPEVEHGPISSLEVEEVEVAGIIRDKQGNVWAVPADSTEELEDLNFKGPFAHLKYDDVMYYQLIRLDELESKRTEGFVPVTKSEVGIDEGLLRDVGKSVSSYVQYVDTILVKMPKVIADRMQARKAKVAQQIVDATMPDPEVLVRARRAGASKVQAKRFEEDAEKEGFVARVERKTRKSAHLTK